MTKLSKEQVQEVLRSLQGNEWKKENLHRFYFNMKEHKDVRFRFYSSGWISSCYVKGEKVSNSDGSKIKKTFDTAKVYYCMEKEEFFVKFSDFGSYRGEELVREALEDLKEEFFKKLA